MRKILQDKGANKRIAQLCLQYYDNNVNAMAKDVGLSQAALRDLVGGRMNAPSLLSLDALLRAHRLRHISARWLLLGEGPMERPLAYHEALLGRLETLITAYWGADGEAFCKALQLPHSDLLQAREAGAAEPSCPLVQRAATYRTERLEISAKWLFTGKGGPTVGAVDKGPEKDIERRLKAMIADKVNEAIELALKKEEYTHTA